MTTRSVPLLPIARTAAPAHPVVLHVAQPTDGGVARYVADLATSQMRGGWPVAVACPPDGRLDRELRARGVEVLAWRATRLPGPALAAEVGRLAALVAEVNPALVHLHSAKAGLAGRLAVRGRRVTIFQPHAWSVHAVPPGLRTAAASWERMAAGWTDVVVCGARDERRRGREMAIAVRYAVVTNGVDLDRFPPSGPDQRHRARARLGLGSGPLAVCVGRMCRQKGQDLLLQAWPRVASVLPDATLALVGPGVETRRSGAAAPPRLIFAGPVIDPRDWYAAADVVVCPSRWEGMALVPLEAMARGRSVVASDVGGAREALPPGTGALVPPGDLNELATAVLIRLADRRRADAEGRAGSEHVTRHHPLRHTHAGVNRVYQEALAARRWPKGTVT